jgi:hypothetical protein
MACGATENMAFPDRARDPARLLCRGRDSNPDGPLGPAEFKSAASSIPPPRLNVDRASVSPLLSLPSSRSAHPAHFAGSLITSPLTDAWSTIVRTPAESHSVVPGYQTVSGGAAQGGGQ